MGNLYHYTESGLDNIYLVNGFSHSETVYGKGIEIERMDKLHVAIGVDICNSATPLTPREFRFLRVEMGLSQKNLGEFMGVDAQTIARWEKGQSSSTIADRFIRALYLEHVKENSSLKELCDELSQIDNKESKDKSFELDSSTGWHIAA